MTQAPRKVLYIVTKSNWGGAQRYVYDLAVGLPRDAFEPVVAFGPAPEGTEPGMLSTRLSQAGVRTVLVPELARDMGLADISAFFALVRLVRRERPSEVHLNSSKAAGLGALAARLAGVQHIIFTVHGWPFRETRGRIARAAIFLASYATVLLAHDTIVLSEYDHDAMRSAPFAHRRLRVIRSGIDQPALTSRDAARRALLPSHADDTTAWVGSVGELTANKDYKTALAAIAGTDTAVRYLIIGDGEDQERIKADIAARGLADRVHMLGFVKNASTLLAAFDILLLTSRKEGLPYVVLEAGRAKLPVIASAVGAIPEVVEHGVDGLLCPAGDTAAFTAAVSTLAADAEARERLGAALEQKVRACYDISRMRLETYKLY